MHAPGLFDLSDHLARLSATGDPLEALERHVDFEVFRTVLMEALGYGVRAKGGRPPYDPVTMFKVLVLAALTPKWPPRSDLPWVCSRACRVALQKRQTEIRSHNKMHGS